MYLTFQLTHLKRYAQRWNGFGVGNLLTKVVCSMVFDTMLPSKEQWAIANYYLS